jgi:hypothetical protein
MSATAASPSLPGVREGDVFTIWRSILAAACWSNSAEATTGGSGAGRAWSENNSTTTAASAGANAAR